MIGPTGTVRVIMATRPVGFRKGVDGLAALVRETMGADPFFCSCVMVGFLSNAEAGRCAPRPLRARPRLSPQLYDTVCQIKS